MQLYDSHGNLTGTPDAEAQETAIKTTPIVHVEPAVKTKPISASKETGENTPKKDGAQSAVVIATIVLAVTSVFGIAFTVCQLQLTRQALESNNQSSKDILFQMNAQSKAMKSSAESAVIAMRDVEERFRRDQRAWLTVDQIKANDVVAGSGFSIFVIVRNTGKTPARAVKYGKWTVRLGEKFRAMQKIESGEAVIGPAAGFGGDVKFEHTWTSQETEQIRIGATTLLVKGEVTYMDLFSTEIRHTTFCAVSVKQNTNILATCRTGNSVD
jgi:hypothetical protein